MFKIVFSISQKYIVFVLKATTGDCFLGGKKLLFHNKNHLKQIYLTVGVQYSVSEC